MKKLSIIIPVFNEEKTIRQLLNRVQNIKLPTGISKEIIVVDDCSTDQTSRILTNLKKIKFKYIIHQKNMGKGASVRTGILNSEGDFIIIQDADLEYDPNDYTPLLEPILGGKSQIVFGTRLINYPLKLWGRNKTFLPLHLLANKFLTWLLNFLYNSRLTDMETGYKLFTREVIEKLHLKSNRFEIEPEITIKSLKLGYNIFEVPIKTKPRGYDEGKKIGFWDGLAAIWIILKYRIIE